MGKFFRKYRRGIIIALTAGATLIMEPSREGVAAVLKTVAGALAGAP